MINYTWILVALLGGIAFGASASLIIAAGGRYDRHMDDIARNIYMEEKGMNTSDQAKLLNARFIIITGEHTEMFGLRIKRKSAARREWHTMEGGFESKAALKRRLTELLQEPFYIDLYDSKNQL